MRRTVSKCIRCSLILVLLGSAAARASAVVYTPQNAEEMLDALAQVLPGDEVVLPPGTHADWGMLPVTRSGTPAAPVVIRSEQTLATVMTGHVQFNISASHVIVEGMAFFNTSSAIPVLLGSGRENRITRCVFRQTQANAFVRANYGVLNRIDHCFFSEPYMNAVVLVGPQSNSYEGAGEIQFNMFRDAPRVPRDGEAIVLWSDGKHLGYELKAEVSWNTFDNWDADDSSEIITVKSGGNTIYRNVFAWCQGYLSLRRENASRVEGNLFFRNTEGIRIYGSDHTIVNNIFEQLDAFGLYMANGWVSGDVEARAAQDCIIVYNTFYNVGRRAWAFYASAEPNTLPTGNLLLNNIVHSEAVTDGLVRDQTGFMGSNPVVRNLFYVGTGTLGPTGTDPILAPAGLAGSQEILRLQGSSAAVGMASAAHLEPADFYGQVRDAVAGDLGHHDYRTDEIPTMQGVPLPPVPTDRADAATAPLAAEFHVFPAAAPVGRAINFDAGPSTGDIVSYKWAFSDGTVVIGEFPFVAHKWDAAGIVEATLTVQHADGSIAEASQLLVVGVDADADTDGDGLLDHEEILSGTDPDNAWDPFIDADGDWIHARVDPDDHSFGVPFARPLALNISTVGQDVHLEWKVAPGVTTSIESSSDLETWTTHIISPPVEAATTDTLQVLNADAFPGEATARSFRMRKDKP